MTKDMTGTPQNATECHVPAPRNAVRATPGGTCQAPKLRQKLRHVAHHELHISDYAEHTISTQNIVYTKSWTTLCMLVLRQKRHTTQLILTSIVPNPTAQSQYSVSLTPPNSTQIQHKSNKTVILYTLHRRISIRVSTRY